MEDSSQNQAKLDCARDNLNKEKSFPNYKANSALSFFFLHTSMDHFSWLWMHTGIELRTTVASCSGTFRW